MRFLPFVMLLLVNCATFDSVVANNPILSGYSLELVDNQRVHLLAIDLTKYVVKPIKANGLALTSTLAFDTRALAAINGGFFQADGTPAGLLVIDKKVLGHQGKPRAAIGWTRDHETVVVDRVLSMPSQGVVSATGDTTSRLWAAIDFAIGGTPLLVRDHKPVTDFAAEKVRDSFLTLKHARSAICVVGEKKWILVAVEGSSSLELSLFGRSGFTMSELGRYMSDALRCRHAINLDGGGSTALIIDNQLMNQTTFGERAVSDALGVFPRT